MGLAADTHAVVNLSVLQENLRLLRQLAGNLPALPAIKANAYGHGAVAVARALQNQVMGFAVATASEALELRGAGIAEPIVLLTPPALPDLAKLVQHNISFVVSSQGETNAIHAEAISQNRRTQVHLKINTGLNRLGAEAIDAAKILASLANMRGLELVGIMTHLVDSEEAEPTHSLRQLELFTNFLEQHKPSVQYIHAANSGGILNPKLQQVLQDKMFNLIRPGISLYGYAPGPDLQGLLPLRPALTFKTRVLFVKTIAPGEIVSYNATWQAQENTRVATIRLGYADGYPRATSGQAQVLLRGKNSDWQVCNVLGRICMDQCVVDASNIPDVAVNDEVIVFGDAKISAENVATWAQTNSYEILTSIAPRVQRVYTE